MNSTELTLAEFLARDYVTLATEYSHIESAKVSPNILMLAKAVIDLREKIDLIQSGQQLKFNFIEKEEG